jgi:hypothetical protein
VAEQEEPKQVAHIPRDQWEEMQRFRAGDTQGDVEEVPADAPDLLEEQ